MTNRVRIIQYGQQGFPGPAFYYMGRFGEMIQVPLYFWLIESEERTILVDVGVSTKQSLELNKEIVQQFGEEAAWIIPHEKSPETQLGELGIQLEDIQHVILTHLHGDHSLNITNIPNAEIIMSQPSWEAISEPAHPGLVPPSQFPYHVIDYLRDEMGKRFRLVDDGSEPFPGVRVFRMGGHSPDLTSITVETAAGEVIIASDAAMFYDSLELGWPSNGYNQLEALRALDWIQKRQGIVLPGHDWKVLDRHPSGVIG